MTAVAEDLDLSWVTFSGDSQPDSCQWRLFTPDRCSLEAVARAYWAPVCCGEAVSPQLLCPDHRDKVAEASKLMSGRFRCVKCLAIVRLLRLEPIR